jgi:hypothetical protein
MAGGGNIEAFRDIVPELFRPGEAVFLCLDQLTNIHTGLS